jgi:hypothetical protein
VGENVSLAVTMEGGQRLQFSLPVREAAPEGGAPERPHGQR